MKGCEALLVFLLCLSEAGAQGQNGAGRGRPPTNWELSDMMLVQQEKIRSLEEESKNLKMSVTVTAAKLTASETQVKLLQSRLSTSEGQTQDMNEGIEDLTSNVTTQQRQTEAQQITLNRDLGILKRRRRHAPNGPRVAFSVALSDGGPEFIGPVDPPQTIVFKHVFFNRVWGPEGSGYNPNTGVFTAPWNAAYYFTFTIMHSGSSYTSGAKLMKNEDVQVSTWSTTDDTNSQTVILALDAWETVKIITWGGNYQVYDNSDYHYTTFSGFLLFPL